MSRFLEWLYPVGERRMVGWFTLTALPTSAFAGVLVYAQPGIDEEIVLWLPGDAYLWYAGAVAASMLATYAFVRGARSHGAPVSIWLVPAFAAAWAAAGPLLDYLLAFGGPEAEFGGTLWNLLPIVALLAPALVATIQANQPREPLLPTRERRQAFAIGGLALALFLANKIAFASPQWADAWLPHMAAEEELGYQ
ncbi:MAG: hypothetical protein OEV43_10100, partial [Coriobacteriia bacterium]|nr:hypothetical protein [Coriobacteriia bacterium]